MWITMTICNIWPPEVVKGSISGNWPLYHVSTLLLGEMLDVATDGPHGGKLLCLCQGGYVWSTWTKQHVGFDCHYIGNSNANCTTGLDFCPLFHVRSEGCLETNIIRRPLCRKISFLYLLSIRFKLWFTSIFPFQHTNNMTPTDCNLRECWKPLQPGAIRSRIRLE